MSAHAGLPPIPEELRRAHRDWVWSEVWRHVPRAVTYRLHRGPDEVRFLKLTARGWYPSVEAEALRTRWARTYLPVPSVLGHGSGDAVEWLLTEGLEGTDATHPALRDDVGALVRMLARGLGAFHTAPVVDCPFDFRLDRSLALARQRLESGRIDPERDFHEEFAHLSAAEAVTRLERTRPATEDVVVCHGDYCLPNVLVSGGEPVGFVDLGELGVADRWWDLAVATWSVEWNLGPGWEAIFHEEYGVALDPERVEFYRLLYDVVS